jgi:hypothetical protein
MSLHRHDSCFHRKVALNKKTPPLSMAPICAKKKKSVRFCDNDSLENVRLFVKTQMPKACRSDPVCPKQYSYHLRCPNWPNETAQTRRYRFGTAVRMEQVQLVSETPLDNNKTLTLTGTCQVANLAFEKHVIIHYTLDDWNTFEEVDGVFKESISSSANTWDRFTFNIVLNTTHHTHKSLYIAIKYIVGDREFWDNNDEKNYEVDVVPKVELDYCKHDLSSSSDDEEDDNVFDDCEEMENLSIQDTPWSPPLSPTTPSDDNPLWSMNSSNYFPPSEEENDRRKIHEFLRNHCFYNDYHRPANYIPYHSPPRCASPKPIRS